MKKIFVVLIAVGLTGCATLFNHGPAIVNLTTSDGTRVEAKVISKSGTQKVFLPALVSISKTCDNVTVEVLENDRINKSVAIVEAIVTPWVLGNILFGGIIGIGIDALAGNLCTYVNNVAVPIDYKK